MAKPRKRGKVEAQTLRKEKRLAKEQENFVAPLTGKRARHIAKAEAGAEYSPVIRQIRGEAKASANREKQVGGWYDQLAADQAANAQRSLQAGAQDAAGTQAAIQTAGAQDAANLQGAAQKNNEFAALVGGPTNAQGLSQIAAGDATRQQQLVSMRAPITAADASNTRLLGRVGTATRYGGIEARQAEHSRRNKILQDLQAAKKQKGQAYVGHLQGLRKEAGQSALDKQAFGLETSEAAEKAKHDAASVAASLAGTRASVANSKRTAASSAASTGVSATNAQIAAQKAQREQEEYEYEQKHGTGSINSKPASANKGRTPSQKREDKQDWQDAQNVAQNAYQTLQEQKAFPGWNLFQQLLVTKYHVRGTIAAKIVKRMKSGNNLGIENPF